MRAFGLVIVGAGPAGMAAAIEARQHQLSVAVIDDQPAPGGQIWRAVEMRAASGEARTFGRAYASGLELVARFRNSGATYLPNTEVWQVEGLTALVKGPAGVQAISGSALLLAVGAQERPFSFPGWTLPGVMTVGAAQILLKSARQIPTGRVWIAGRGPLPLLYAKQLLAVGGELTGYLDLDAPGGLRRSARHLPGAMRHWRDIAKGLAWLGRLNMPGAPGRVRATTLAAGTSGRLESIAWTDVSGARHEAPADVLLVHDSLVPSNHMALSLGCRWQWHSEQHCQTLELDAFNETSVENVFGAGDCCQIGGAELAAIEGRIAALGVAQRLGRLSEVEGTSRLVRLKKAADRHKPFRAFLDALYRRRLDGELPTGKTLVCRCEDLDAHEIGETAARSRGLNQVKAATRICMGPCQGRQCAETLRAITAHAKHCSPESLGQIAARPPFRPVTLGEVASLDYEPQEIERM